MWAPSTPCTFSTRRLRLWCVMCNTHALRDFETFLHLHVGLESGREGITICWRGPTAHCQCLPSSLPAAVRGLQYIAVNRKAIIESGRGQGDRLRCRGRLSRHSSTHRVLALHPGFDSGHQVCNSTSTPPRYHLPGPCKAIPSPRFERSAATS